MPWISSLTGPLRTPGLPSYFPNRYCLTSAMSLFETSRASFYPELLDPLKK